MLKKYSLILFPLTILSFLNPSLANTNKNNWFDYGFNVGTFTQTCALADDKIISTKEARKEMEIIFEYASEDLDRDFYESFTNFASETKDCVKYLP